MTRELQNKLNLPAAEANKAAGGPVPQTMQQLATKTANPPDNGFKIQDIFNKLSENKTSGFNIQALPNRLAEENWTRIVTAF